MPSVGVQEYLARIDFQGQIEPTLPVLQQLVKKHLMAVPFENLDMLLQIPFSLDRHALWDKIVTSRRGGVCHELNHSFYYLLKELGFQVHFGSARIDTADDELEHTDLRVRIEDKLYLADVGFGSQPIPLLDLSDGRPQVGFGFQYRVQAEPDGTISLLHLKDDTYQHLQYLYTQKRQAEDFIPSFQRDAIPGATPFSIFYICSRVADRAQYRLVRNCLKIKTRKGLTQVNIPDGVTCAAVLEEYFGILLPDGIGPADLEVFL